MNATQPVMGTSAEAPVAGPRTLYQRLCAIMADLGAIPKTGINQGQGNYRFIESAEMMAILRPRFAEHGVVLLPEVLSHTVSRPEQSRQVYVTVSLRITLVNADLPEDRVSLLWLAEAADVGDKAINKAITAGVKYALLKLLLLSDREEPDADATDAGVTTAGLPASERPPAVVKEAARVATAGAAPVPPASLSAASMAQQRESLRASLAKEFADLANRLRALDADFVVPPMANTANAVRAQLEQLRIAISAHEPAPPSPEPAGATR
jgi:hypothetical protein